MKKLLLTLSIGVGATFGFFNKSHAQETQIKFFGQPEFSHNTLSEQGTPSDWGPDFDPTNSSHAILNETKRDTSNTNFNTGKMVLFVTSQLNDRISVLGEMSASTGKNKFNFEIERLMLRYYVKDYFSLRVGKMFNPIGYWNNQYNLGLVLQPTIQRPLVIRNSSDGGVLQIKDVGAQIEGDNITKLRLSYRVMASNGIGFFGDNDKKVNGVALTANVGIEPIEGLKFIISGRTSDLYKGTTTQTGINPYTGKQITTNAALAYMNPEKRPEFIAEYHHSKNALDSVGDRFSQGYFVYAGYKVTNKIVPYAMYSYSQAGTKTTSDKYYVGYDGVLVNLTEVVAGFRYKISSNFVYKLEYVYSSTNYTYLAGSWKPIPDNALPFPYNTPTAITSDQKGFEKSSSVRMQFAFAF